MVQARFLLAPVVAAVMAGVVVVSSPAARAGEVEYERVGAWTVTATDDGGRFAYCAANTGGRARLSIASDGKMWQIGVPYGGGKRKVEGYYGFGVAGEVANFNSTGDGVAVLRISNDQVQAFASLPEFSVNLTGREQTWQLAGGGSAIAKVRDCVRNQGVRVATRPMPGFAPPPGTGRDCPPPGRFRSQNGSRPVTVTFYNGSNRPWDIYWIGYDGQWKKYHTLRPDSNVEQKTFATHPWVAVDARGNCFRDVFLPDPSNNPENNNFQIFDN
jgi:hypothetical protein